MGHQVQRQQPKGDSPAKKQTKFKANSSKNTCNKSKYVGLRQRPSGKWVAEIKDTTQKIRMWLGSFETAEEAATAYNEAACLLPGSNTRTNFSTPVFTNSHVSLKIRNLLNHKKSLKQSSPSAATSTGNNTKANIKPCTIVSNNNSNIGGCTSSNDSFLSSSSYDYESFLYNGMKQDALVFDDAYRPGLSICIGDFGASSTTQFDRSWPFPTGFDLLPVAREGIQLPNKHVSFFPEQTDVEFSELECMKEERQISASFYAINGVNEYLENAFDPSRALWDLPPLCLKAHLFFKCYEF